MPITPEDARELQIKILEICHASGRFGMLEDRIKRKLEDTGYLKRQLIREGHGVDNDTLERQLKYLEGDELIELKPEDDLRPDIRRWVSTSKGDKLLMKEGLI